ncbi:hypothetical protein D3C74_434250 [compost metagenome]
MDFTKERCHMVLALAVVHDIFHDDQLFMILVKGDTQHVTWIHFISTKNLFVHPGYTRRRFQKPFTCAIFSDQFENLFDMILDLLPIVGYF